MPQMAPLMWLSLYFFIIMVTFMLLTNIFFLKTYNPKLKFFQKTTKKLIWKL